MSRVLAVEIYISMPDRLMEEPVVEVVLVLEIQTGIALVLTITIKINISIRIRTVRTIALNRTVHRGSVGAFRGCHRSLRRLFGSIIDHHGVSSRHRWDNRAHHQFEGLAWGISSVLGILFRRSFSRHHRHNTNHHRSWWTSIKCPWVCRCAMSHCGPTRPLPISPCARHRLTFPSACTHHHRRPLRNPAESATTTIIIIITISADLPPLQPPWLCPSSLTINILIFRSRWVPKSSLPIFFLCIND